eukprot:3517210-Pyramimonas_sp.AAC.2
MASRYLFCLSSPGRSLACDQTRPRSAHSRSLLTDSWSLHLGQVTLPLRSRDIRPRSGRWLYSGVIFTGFTTVRCRLVKQGGAVRSRLFHSFDIAGVICKKGISGEADREAALYLHDVDVELVVGKAGGEAHFALRVPLAALVGLEGVPLVSLRALHQRCERQLEAPHQVVAAQVVVVVHVHQQRVLPAFHVLEQGQPPRAPVSKSPRPGPPRPESPR